MAKIALKKYRLTQAQLRSLTIAKWPELDQQGNVVIVSNPTGKPYRFVDGTPGAPVGFGFYVGPMGAFYELRIQHNGVRRRLALGSVQELTLARAHELAGAQRHHIRHTGEDPRERVRTEAARQKARGKTVGEALEDYIAHLEDRLARGRAKAGGVEGVKDALARLQRPEVNLADKAIAALTAKDLLAAWNGLRHTCMLQSNRLSPGTKAFLTKQGEWWNLKLEDLVRLGLTGKTLARAHAAGLSATEQTMGNASRAVARAIKAVLTRASPEYLDKHGQELMAWLDGFYIGGSEAARRDKDLRNAPTRLPTLRERAVYRRLAVLERSQISLDDIGTPLEYAHPAPEPAQPEPPPAPVGDAGWKTTQQIMFEQEVFFTRLAERQRRKIERDRQQRARIEKAGDDLAKQTVVLGAGSTVSLDDIDWETSRFPDRDKPTRVDPGAMRTPTTSGRNHAPAPRKRPGMLPTQPRLPTAPEPPKPPGWDQELGM